MNEKIAIGCDHAGFTLKELIKKLLTEKGYILNDFGTDSAESIDYPDIIHPVAEAVNQSKFFKGIILCGSGNGAAMVANKYPHVRAAICWNEEITKLSRMHNDANIISLPARFITTEEALKFVTLFLETNFEGGRHEIRVMKI